MLSFHPLEEEVAQEATPEQMGAGSPVKPPLLRMLGRGQLQWHQQAPSRHNSSIDLQHPRRRSPWVAQRSAAIAKSRFAARPKGPGRARVPQRPSPPPPSPLLPRAVWEAVWRKTSARVSAVSSRWTRTSHLETSFLASLRPPCCPSSLAHRPPVDSQGTQIWVQVIRWLRVHLHQRQVRPGKVWRRCPRARPPPCPKMPLPWSQPRRCPRHPRSPELPAWRRPHRRRRPHGGHPSRLHRRGGLQLGKQQEVAEETPLRNLHPLQPKPERLIDLRLLEELVTVRRLQTKGMHPPAEVEVHQAVPKASPLPPPPAAPRPRRPAAAASARRPPRQKLQQQQQQEQQRSRRAAAARREALLLAKAHEQQATAAALVVLRRRVAAAAGQHHHHQQQHQRQRLLLLLPLPRWHPRQL